MKRKRAAAGAIGILSACSLIGSAAVFASVNAGNETERTDTSLRNGFINLTVDQNEDDLNYLRFDLGTTGGQTNNSADDNKELTYDKFYTGYTTITIDGTDYIYGQGEDVTKPEYDVKGKCHTSSQRFGDTVVQQKLTFSEGYTRGYEDMLEISYKVVEGSDNSKVGVRILLDPTVDSDDMLSLTADNAKVTNEAQFNGKLPSGWKASTRSNDNISAYGKISGADPQPSSVLFANWGNVYDTLSGYTPDINSVISDSAAAVIWEPSDKSVNKEFTTLYGVKNAANTAKTGKSPNTSRLDSPKTGVTIPIASVALLAAGVSGLGASLIISRKEKNDDEE